MPDDYSADRLTTGTVAVDGTATGAIETARDQDWFAVELVAGRTYVFDLEGSRTNGGTLSDPYIRGIYDASGSLLPGTSDDDGGSGLNSRLTYTPAQSGTHYVSAGAYSVREGTYTLSVTDVTPVPQQQGLEPSVLVSEVQGEDLSTDTTTPGVLAIDGAVTGTIGTVGDRDWFAVKLVAGRTYVFDLEGSPTDGGTLTDPYLRGIHDASGTLLSGTVNDDGGEGYNSRLTYTPAQSGIHYVSAGAFSSRTGTYTLSVRDTTPASQEPESESQATAGEDVPADTTTSSVLAVDGAVSSAIETEGDRDWFAVELEAGQAYVFNLEGTGTQSGTLRDPYLRGIYDATGTLLPGTSDDDSGEELDSRLTYTPAEKGVYYVSAGAYSGTGTYTLSVAHITSAEPEQEEPAQQQESDDLPADTTTTGVATVDGSVTGTIGTAGDRDWFAVTLASDTTYIIDVEGKRSGVGTLDHPLLRGIYDSTGAVVAPADSDGELRPGRIFFSPSADGKYFLAASGVGESTGSYTLRVTAVVDIAADTTTTASVPVNNGRWGYIETPGDTDWFKVTLEAGTSYRIDLKGLDFGIGELVDTNAVENPQITCNLLLLQHLSYISSGRI